MKKLIALFFIIGGVAVIALAIGAGDAGVKTDYSEFLRLHIRANSNSAVDQDIKYIIKQEIVNELTPIFADVTTRSEAIKRLGNNLSLVEAAANRTLAEAGFNYKARAAIKSEYFPTRTYNDVSLPEGLYDALIINLGTGEGDNWWCVVYPPLCFLENNIGGDSGVKYRSKLQEIIKKYF